MIARNFSLRLFLLGTMVLALPRQDITAATQLDSEIELLETTYRVSTDGTAEITIHKRVKALTGNGRADVSRVQIPFNAGFSDVEIKFIKTTKKDGSIVSGDPGSAFDTTPSADPLAPSYTDLRLKTILAPNLESGDLVEYEAVTHVRKWAKPEAFWFVHYVTNSARARVLSEVVVLDLPAERQVAFYESKTIPGKPEIANGRRIERWVTASPEQAKASAETTEPLFAVSSIVSWDALGAWVHSLNKDATEPTPEILALAAKLTANKSTQQDRIAALYTYVATKVRYVGISFGIGALQPHMASAVLHSAYGDCKDQTALLSALLTAAGFKAYAVLTKPKVGVAVRDVPTPNQFSHEFAAVETGSGLVFLDTSMGPVSPGVLQPGVRGRTALLIGEKSSSLVDIPLGSPVPLRVSETVKGTVSAAGAFEGTIRFEFEGTAEPTIRRAFLDGADVEKLLRGIAGSVFRNAKVRQISNADPGDLTKKFWVQCELSHKDFFPPATESLHVNSRESDTFAEDFGEIRKPDRPWPVEAMTIVTTIDLIVDPRLTVAVQMPAHFKSAFGVFDSESSYQNEHVVLTQSFELKDTLVAPSDWDAFVAFLSSWATGTTRGFTLERRIAPPPASVVLSPLARSLQEGAAATQRRDYEAAKRAYLDAIRLDPKNRSAWNNLGRAYYALHEYDEAEQAYKRQIEINPQYLSAYNNLGLVYRVLKREDEAIASFRKQIAVTPRDETAWNNLGGAYHALHEYDEAEQAYKRLIEINPEDLHAYNSLGMLYHELKREDEAIALFRKQIAISPRDRSAWNNLGRAYSALHKYDEAEQAYKRQIEINPRDLYAYNNLGLVYRVLRREDEAIALFRKQIAVSPRDRFAHENLSISLGAKNQWEQAREEAAIAVDITPEDAAKWARLGKAQIKTNRIDDARQSLNRALALPHDAMTVNNVAYYMAEAGIDLDKALQLVSGALNSEARLVCEPEALSKDDKCGAQLRRTALMLDTAGWVLFRQDKLADADPYLLSAYAINPRTEIEIHLSSLLSKAGRLDESLKYYAAARSNADFSRFDSSALRSELVKALGGERQLDSRINPIQNTVVSPASTTHFIALVDGHGRVLDVQSTDPNTPASLASEAKSMTLPPISWPEHSIRSIRTIEFRLDGAKWSLNQSYVAQSPDPAPVP
jgi:tetratricopeptide (TPR) repeat protein